MSKRRVIAVSVGIVLAATLSPLPAGAAQPRETTTSVTCSNEVAPITDAQREQVKALAATRLADLSGPSTLPFGATGASRYQRTNAYAWTSGFFPSSLWLMYAIDHDPVWLDRARQYTDRVLPVASWRGTHDLGFMVGQPARLGLFLDPSPTRQRRYADALLTAARTLSDRWNPKVRALRSATYNGRWGVIIDSVMNAPMLLDAGLILGGADGQLLMRRGREHLLTVARTFVRENGSTFHRLTFDPRTGRLLGPVPGQGLSTTSTWARGQAWAVNGFTRGYRLTRDQRLLDAARRTADYWIARVPKGCVPAWDLDVTDDRAPRDSSAAAIMADGLIELAAVESDAARSSTYRDHALALLGTLAGPTWLPTGAAVQGLLHRQAYSIPGDAREGTYVWGDTYLLGSVSSSG